MMILLQEWSPSTTSFPDGYPAYCIYIPTGMNIHFEKQVLAKLEEFGESMGKNLFVAPWNIGDPSYIQLMRRIEIKQRPTIILTDSNSPDKNSLMIVLDSKLIKNINELTEILPSLVDLILQGDKKSVIKSSIQAGRRIKLKSLLDHFDSIMKKVKISFSWNGITVEPA
jgi:hypothetical protein